MSSAPSTATSTTLLTTSAMSTATVKRFAAVHVPLMLWLVLLFVVVAAHSVHAAPVVRMERPQRNDVSSVADAIRYLQELDQYYGQISRPRFGKRTRPFNLAQHLSDPENVRMQIDQFAEDDWKAKLLNERR